MNSYALNRRSSNAFKLDGSRKAQTNRRASTLDPLEDMVTCPIDLNFLEDPRLLPCGHAFCCQCLNRYMEQLTRSNKRSKTKSANESSIVPCPICRSPCPKPVSNQADSLPKAFNHTAILDFLRKNRLTNYRVNGIKTGEAGPSPQGTPPANRKTSIQVSSQMLNYLVQDIATRDRDGKMQSADKAVILEDVRKLLQQLQTGNGKEKNHRISLEPSVLKKQPDESPVTTPSGSSPNLGRFQAFASRIRNGRRSSSLTGYNIYRDVETVRVKMKENSVYSVLSKGKDCCIMRPGEPFQPVDMQMIAILHKPEVASRFTITASAKRNEMILWRQTVRLFADNLMVDRGSKNKQKDTLVQYQAPVFLNDMGPLKVQYIRFFRNHIYLTGLISASNTTHQESENITAINEYGVLVRCSIPNFEDCNQVETEKMEHQSTSQMFNIEAMSQFFQRDMVGDKQREHPIVFGLDIDQHTGDIYVTQPANSMICRVKANDLSILDETWYFDNPEMAPYFVCYATTTKQVWATCPKENKILILDLDTDTYQHFVRGNSFTISPSHIIYTTDERIILLDGDQASLYWISKVHETICIQKLDVKFDSQVKRRLLVIQPVDNNSSSIGAKFLSSRCDNSLQGGLLCAHDYGCSLIYPKKQLNHLKETKISCFNFCI